MPLSPRQPVVRSSRLPFIMAAAALALLVQQAISPRSAQAVGSSNVVISQVYGGGGNSGATLKNDFIELFNRGTDPVNLGGMSVQYASAAGTTWQVTNLTGVLQPGQYYLVQEAQGAGGTTNLPAPDAAGTIAMSANNGKVVLVSGTVALNVSCPTAGVIDFVGFGTANCSEGPPTGGLVATTAALRGGFGCTETDNNSADFATGSPNPRNTATALHPCGSPTPTPTPTATPTATPTPTPSPTPPLSNSTVVISQIYGGGGNASATYQNDYVELYNRSGGIVDLTGWSIQYSSAAGDSWEFGRQPLGGPIAPGEYLLVSLASGGAVGAVLPPANIDGLVNMSGTTGKLALVNSFEPLVGTCPVADPHVKDFVGYGGTANCWEGASRAPAGSNTAAIFRRGDGATDTDINGGDFLTGPPLPRRTAPIVELGPLVLSTDPRTNGVNAPRDATIQVTFTEAVDVEGTWWAINCAVTGIHDSATTAGDGRDHYITPNVNFAPGEQCTVTVFKDQIHDVDLDDSGLDTDSPPANHVWSFTVATGTAPPYLPDEHLVMGNPSGAVEDVTQENNYLMKKPEFALAYNRSLGAPNWVSWHLSDDWIGSLIRVDTFRADPAVPPEWYRVQSFDFANSGFDRGHMVPNADRDKETSIPINQATFLMTNMVAQAPDNNQGPWADFEGYLRTLTPAQELYIVSGGVGVGGSGSNGFATTVADGHVTVPAQTWKVALVLDKDGGDDIGRVTCSTRTIAILMPNTQGIRTTPWANFLTTIDAVESLTGYDFFSNLPDPYERCVEAGLNGVNPPLDTDDDGVADTADNCPTNANTDQADIDLDLKGDVCDDDSYAPTISAAATTSPNLAGWYNTNVTVHFTCADEASGIPEGACPADQVLSAEGAAVSSTAQTVYDNAGHVSAPSNVVTVSIDKTAPAIVVPANQTVNATSPLGATVTYANATGTDPGGSGLSALGCAPASGSVFPIGTTPVTCSAVDNAGNTNSGTFTVSVKGAADQLAVLLNQVNGVGAGQSLENKIGDVLAYVAAGDTAGACSKLQAFMNEVQAQSGKKLTAAQAASFIAQAQSIRAVLGC